MSTGCGLDSSAEVGSVARAMAILACFEDADELGVTQIADRIGVAKSTASRLLHTLRRSGVVEQDPASGRYRLGLRLHTWGELSASRRAVRVAARPVLRDLCSQVDVTVALVVSSADGVVHLDRAEPRHAVDFWAQHGSRFSRRGAGGIVMAASSPTATRSRDADLVALIACARETGHALEFGHVIDGIASLAVPVRRLDRTEGALAFIADQRLLGSRATRQDLVALGMRAAREIGSGRRPEEDSWAIRHASP